MVIAQFSRPLSQYTVIRIRVYTFLRKFGGHSVSSFKVTGGGLLKPSNPPPSPLQEGRKKPCLNRVKFSNCIDGTGQS